MFEQQLAGRIARFSGAESSALPRSWTRRLANEAGRLGFFLQRLGYFGRCSFDAIIVGEDPKTEEAIRDHLAGLEPGTEVAITVFRHGQTLTLTTAVPD